MSDYFVCCVCKKPKKEYHGEWVGFYFKCDRCEFDEENKGEENENN